MTISHLSISIAYGEREKDALIIATISSNLNSPIRDLQIRLWMLLSLYPLKFVEDGGKMRDSRKLGHGLENQSLEDQRFRIGVEYNVLGNHEKQRRNDSRGANHLLNFTTKVGWDACP